jgi:hypothetical protein
MGRNSMTRKVKRSYTPKVEVKEVDLSSLTANATDSPRVVAYAEHGPKSPRFTSFKLIYTLQRIQRMTEEEKIRFNEKIEYCKNYIDSIGLHTEEEQRVFDETLNEIARCSEKEKRVRARSRYLIDRSARSILNGSFLHD